jgi:hypothetical protein
MVLLSVVLLLVLRTLARGRQALDLLVLVPLATWVLDYTENIGVWTLLATFPSRLDGLVQVMSPVTVAKQALGLVSVALTGICVVVLLGRQIAVHWLQRRAMS